MGASAVLFAAYPFTTTHALGIPARYMVGDKNNWGPRVGFKNQGAASDKPTAPPSSKSAKRYAPPAAWGIIAV
ncbi:MAG: hypothetical protein DMG57_38295 [Acidobacteria bacterium]|nr:MAG: hypothetical protein DMG57_38295 [Acidobacteriota bacterium]